MKNGKNLNIGCGNLEFKDCVNIDIKKTPIVDIVLDLEKYPWPFEDEQFERVYAYDIIEHFDNVIKAIEEIHRVLKTGGFLIIHTNHYKYENAFTDPTHRHFFAMNSFDYFDPTTEFGKKYGFYSEKKFKIINKHEDGQELYFELKKL